MKQNRRGSVLNTDTAWELWAQRDPYYGVLTDPRYRRSTMTPEIKEEFLNSGRLHVDWVIAVCRRFFDPHFAPRRALDFGCGVGRTLIPFAGVVGEVVGADVAPSMLVEARRNCLERGVANAALVLSDDALTRITGTFDLIHSSMVLQHIEPLRGRRLLGLLLDRLEPGGCGVIHVTFGLTLHAASFGRPVHPLPPPPTSKLTAARVAVRSWLDRGRPEPLAAAAELAVTADPEMQMHWYQLSDVMFILQRAGVANVFSEFTDHGGAIGAVLYFRKAALP